MPQTLYYNQTFVRNHRPKFLYGILQFNDRKSNIFEIFPAIRGVCESTPEVRAVNSSEHRCGPGGPGG